MNHAKSAIIVTANDGNVFSPAVVVKRFQLIFNQMQSLSFHLRSFRIMKTFHSSESFNFN